MKPHKIELRALSQSWKVKTMFTETVSPTRLLVRPEKTIILLGKRSLPAWKKLLREWVKTKAKIFLSRRLEQLSLKHRLPYRTLVFRNAHTRWGSCSEKKDISLNYQLIFLPRSLAEYVLLHELAHTRYLNHSEQFWDFMKKHSPRYLRKKNQLAEANRYLPRWYLD